jgi:HEPN domain-containing protein
MLQAWKSCFFAKLKMETSSILVCPPSFCYAGFTTANSTTCFNNSVMTPSAIVKQVPTVPKTLLKRLVKALGPQMIFFRNHHYVIVLNASHTQRHKHYEKIIRACRLGENASYTLCQEAELQRQYRLGTIFWSSFCIPENCVYASGDNQVETLWQRLVNTRDNAAEAFTTGIGKANSFYEGACFYWAKGDQNMAAFMLHQATELCLRSLVMAFTGQEVRTHVLSELRNHIARFAPEIASCLCVKTVKQKQIFSLLESAYSHSRYTNNFQINAEDILQLLQQVQRLHHVATMHMQHIIGILCRQSITIIDPNGHQKLKR